ncbi:MAG: bifunctional oligoribonuclease/PAP phosphatase NrnA [Muribaculaceae bacterium]|nr:bifunctional oligoribonuclease/PAP phosphatase NrnA [Muribaculaceae bacterium]
MKKFLSTADVARFEELLANSEKIVLTCHVRPDGDAMGSTLGWYHLLKGLGKKPMVVTPDQPPRTLSFMPGFREVAVYTRHDPYCQSLMEEADLIICCDFNKPSRQDQLGPLTRDAKCRKVLIDHHQDPDHFCDVTFSYPDMSSTCEMTFRIMAAMGLYEDMGRDCAECLVTGMVTDTRNFSVNIKSPDIYEVLERLLEKGVDKTRIVKEALMTRTYGSVRLHAYALSEKMEILPRQHASIITLSLEELKQFHYERGDSEGLVNTPLEIRGVVSSFFLREDEDCIKVSARSINDFPVSLVCGDLFGGGGHIMAAGAEFHGTLEEARRMLVEALPAYDKYIKGHPDRIDLW